MRVIPILALLACSSPPVALEVRPTEAHLASPGLLSVGESAPLVLTLRDDAGGPWEGEVACEAADDQVAAVDGRRVRAVGPGETVIRCPVADTTLTQPVRVQPLPSLDLDALTWGRDTHLRIDDGGQVHTRRIVFDDLLGAPGGEVTARLSEPVRLTTDRGETAWLVLGKRRLHSSPTSSTTGGYAWVVVPEGDDELRVVAELELGRKISHKGGSIGGIGWPHVRPGGLCLQRHDYGWVDGELVLQEDRDPACPPSSTAPP